MPQLTHKVRASSLEVTFLCYVPESHNTVLFLTNICKAEILIPWGSKRGAVHVEGEGVYLDIPKLRLCCFDYLCVGLKSDN